MVVARCAPQIHHAPSITPQYLVTLILTRLTNVAAIKYPIGGVLQKSMKFMRYIIECFTLVLFSVESMSRKIGEILMFKDIQTTKPKTSCSQLIRVFFFL